jgi:hypothetical protein
MADMLEEKLLKKVEVNFEKLFAEIRTGEMHEAILREYF